MVVSKTVNKTPDGLESGRSDLTVLRIIMWPLPAIIERFAMEKKIIAVIGAGIIGADVALDLAINNYSVLLKDLTDSLLDKAMEKIQKSYRFVRMMRKADSLPPVEEVLQRIKPKTDRISSILYIGYPEANSSIQFFNF